MMQYNPEPALPIDVKHNLDREKKVKLKMKTNNHLIQNISMQFLIQRRK